LSAAPIASTACCSAPIIASTACTDWARLRKSLSIIATSISESGGCPVNHLGAAGSGAALKAAARGACSPGNASASRGAGVYGAWGANVAISIMNGVSGVCCLMKFTAAADRTSVM